MSPTLFDPDVRVESDVTYLDPARAEKLDVYLPPADMPGPYPAVLLIHGGGWRILDKAQDREKNIGYTFAKAGYAVFSINYALNEITKDPVTGKIVSEKVVWPQNLFDCKTALRWIRRHASQYQVDGSRIATMGGSAGGHLATLVAATAKDEAMNRGGLYLEESNAVTCVLNFYGVTVPRDRWVACFRGATDAETEANMKACSPLTYLDDDFPPIFITHGSGDATVEVDYSREFVAELARRKLPYWYFEIGNAPHTYNLQPEHMDLRPLVLQFLKEQLAGR
ncbi:alpha/beta hydrolase [Cerasicoccus fimbriatus]|uniref:alpha/beta hydrolase n=1 Tax=Cerasicoccus fimbriatus TaxID=3014554 RepID=UPI0022B45310|nr:alpha/beta hydrolase [Cerasicoccus sp. TK19100]